jgi:hypothetical protein
LHPTPIPAVLRLPNQPILFYFRAANLLSNYANFVDKRSQFAGNDTDEIKVSEDLLERGN